MHRELVEGRIGREADEPTKERRVDAADAIAQHGQFDDVAQCEQQRIDEEYELERRPEQRAIKERSARRATIDTLEKLVQRSAQVRDVGETPIDHQRSEEELEQERQTCL